MIGTRVKELRKRDRLSQEELGRKLGVVKQTISAWENDKYDPDYATIVKVSNFFGVTVDYLSGITDEVPDSIRPVDYLANLPNVDRILIEMINNADNKELLIRLIETYNRLDPDHQYILMGEATKMAIESKPVADGEPLGTGTLGK